MWKSGTDASVPDAPDIARRNGWLIGGQKTQVAIPRQSASETQKRERPVTNLEMTNYPVAEGRLNLMPPL
jgi:hypothetical protein